MRWAMNHYIFFLTVRPMTQMENMENTRSNLMESYDGTRYTVGEIDTRLPSESDDIDARFGASTRINEHYNSSPLDPRFSDTTYQLDSNYKSNNRVGMPPRGIFDDV